MSPSTRTLQTYTPAPVENVFYIDVERIEPNPYQPRQLFSDEELQDLANSIRENGLLQPILVRPIRGKERDGIFYQLADGERRWRAMQKLGRAQIAATVRDLNDEQMMVTALVANDQRVELTDYEKAMQFIRIVRHSEELGLVLSQADIARQMGRSLTFVRNRLLVPQLPEDVQEVAKKRSNVASSLAEIAKLPKPDRAPLLAQVDRDNPAGFRVIKKQIDDFQARRKLLDDSRRAPDLETSTRSKENAHSGGGNVSRGLQVKGNTDIQARAALESVLTTMDGHIHTFEAWKKSNPRAFAKLEHRVLEVAHKLEKLTKEE